MEGKLPTGSYVVQGHVLAHEDAAQMPDDFPVVEQFDSEANPSKF